jgi:hypothetical protein
MFDNCTRYLNDSQLGHWYGKNMIDGYGPKTSPLPIGLAAEEWPHGNSRKVLEAALSAPAWELRNTSVYLAIDKGMHEGREKVAEHMSLLPGTLYMKEKVDYATYLKQVANSKFIAAPRGTGIDTHRAWEVSMAA